MTTKLMSFNGFNKKSTNNKYIVDIRNVSYELGLLWNKYAQTAFLTITDMQNNNLITSKALVNNLRIRHKDLPTVLVFTHKDFKKYEPTLDNFEKEFVLMWQENEGN